MSQTAAPRLRRFDVIDGLTGPDSGLAEALPGA